MEDKKKYRYPGINSFENTDSNIFFGREDDRKKLADLVEIEKTVLLYSRSGLGKSSLLKAALVPELLLRGYQCFYIRLGLFRENSVSPVQNVLLRTALSQQSKLPDTFLKKFINRTTSLWYAFKAMQINKTSKESPVVLIFDQFEEITSYPPAQVLEFKQQLSELQNAPVPKSYIDALKYEELLIEPLTDEETDLLYKPLRIKIVFSIRSDQMSVINELSDYLPNILKVFYELKPLNKIQALDAIQKPAIKDGAFITPPFIYQQEAIDKLLNALATEKNNDIDTSQLQILLQYIEQDIVQKQNDTSLTASDLGNLNQVYEDYYHNSILKLDTEQAEAQLLIEDKLIADKKRISYDMALCLQLVSKATLDKLVETRLLRKEPNTTGGYSYELADDKLVAPVLEARQRRMVIEEEARQKADYDKKLKEQSESLRRKRSRAIIIMVIVILVIFSGVTFFQLRQSAAAVKKARAFMLSIQSEYILNKNPTVALDLAYEATKLYPDTFIVDRAFDILLKNRFYKNIVSAQPKSFIAISRDASRIITCSPQGADSIYDANGKLLYAFTQPGKLRAVDFSKDHNLLLLGSENGDVVLREAITGKIKNEIKGDGFKITTALFSPDENTILLRSENEGQVKLLDKNLNYTAAFNTGFIICAMFSPDGTKVLTGAKDGVAMLWNLKGHALDSFYVWGGDIMSLSSIDEKRFLVGSWDGMISEWNTDIKQKQLSSGFDFDNLTKFNNNDAISAIAWTRSNDSFYIFTGSYKGLLTSWDSVQNGGQVSYQKAMELKGDTGTTHNIVYDPSKKLLYSCSNDGTVKRWAYPIRDIKDSVSKSDKKNILDKFMRNGNIEPLTASEKKQYNIIK